MADTIYMDTAANIIGYIGLAGIIYWLKGNITLRSYRGWWRTPFKRDLPLNVWTALFVMCVLTVGVFYLGFYQNWAYELAHAHATRGL